MNIQILEFGASSYKRFGWATEQDLPPMRTLTDLIAFFEKEEDDDAIHFEVLLEGLGNMSSHDDGECCFIFFRRSDAMALLKSVVPSVSSGLLIAKLIAGQGSYFTIEKVKSLPTQKPYSRLSASISYMLL